MWKKYFQIIVIVIITTVLAEITFRIYHKINPVFIFYDQSYHRFRGQPLAYDYDFQLNSKGFKDLEFNVEKGSNFRILGIGDSFAYGVVPYSFNYLTLLENGLKKFQPNVEVINMDIPGIGPKDYMSLLYHEGLALNPDWVLLSFFIGNDFLEHSTQKFYSYSYLIAFFKYLFDIQPHYQGHIIHGPAFYQDEAPSFSDQKFLAIEISRSLIYRKDSDFFNQHFNYTIKQLKQIQRICHLKQIQWIVVVIPDELQVNQSLQLEMIQKLKLKDTDFDFSQPNRKLVQQLQTMNIKVIDLYLSFLQAQPQRLYKPNDTHWNIAGNQFAATQIQHALIKNFFNDSKELKTND